jgi:hypothetical protein
MPSESEIDNVRKQYFKKFIIENFDNISPITHVNIYKKEYTDYF